MRYLPFVLLVVFVLSVAAPAAGTLYEYRDADGNTRFTDDLGTVPEDKRENIRRIQEVPESSTPSEEQEPPEETEEAAVDADAGDQAEGDQAENDDADLVEKREALRSEQAELQTEYEGIQEEKAQIGDPPDEDAPLAEFEAYGEKVDQINDRIRAYQEKLKAHEERVKAYNARFEE